MKSARKPRSNLRPNISAPKIILDIIDTTCRQDSRPVEIASHYAGGKNDLVESDIRITFNEGCNLIRPEAMSNDRRPLITTLTDNIIVISQQSVDCPFPL